MNERAAPPAPVPTSGKPKARLPRRWLPYAGGVMLAVLLALGLWPRPVPAEIARATVGPLQATVNEEGKTRIRERFVISAPVTGQLRRVPFKAGAEVQAGQTILAVIDPIPPTLLDARSRALAEARRDTAAAQVEKARASQLLAKSELHRVEALFAAKTVSIQELELAQWRETTAVKELAAAESAWQEAEAALAEFQHDGGTNAVSTPTEVRAPVSGRVLRVFEESSRVVVVGTPLLELGDPANLEVVIEVLSRDGAVIAPGARVELEQWGGSEPLIAQVRLVEPAAFTKISALGVEEQRVNVVADLVTPLEQRRALGDNFRVEARVVVWQSDRTLKVPNGALFRRGDRWAAFVLEGNRARLRWVTAGRSGSAETQVVAGLDEGDAVVVYPGDRIRDGQRVRPVHVGPERPEATPTDRARQP